MHPQISFMLWYPVPNVLKFKVPFFKREEVVFSMCTLLGERSFFFSEGDEEKIRSLTEFNNFCDHLVRYFRLKSNLDVQIISSGLEENLSQ